MSDQTPQQDPVAALYTELGVVGINPSDVLAARRANEVRLAERREDLIATVKLFDSLPPNDFWHKPQSIDVLVNSSTAASHMLALVDNRDAVHRLFQELIQRDYHVTDYEKMLWRNTRPMLTYAPAIVDVATTDAAQVIALYPTLRNLGLPPVFYYEAGIFGKLTQVREFMKKQDEITALLRDLRPLYDEVDLPYFGDRLWDIHDLFGYTSAFIALAERREEVVTFQRRLITEVGAPLSIYALVRSGRADDKHGTPRVLTYLDSVDDVVRMYRAIKETIPTTKLNGHTNWDDFCYAQFLRADPEQVKMLFDKHDAFLKVLSGIKRVNGWGEYDAFYRLVEHPALRYVLDNPDVFVEDCRRADIDRIRHHGSGYTHFEAGTRAQEIFDRYARDTTQRTTAAAQ